MYHSSLINQLPSQKQQQQFDQKSSTSKCSNQSKCSSSIRPTRSINDVQTQFSRTSNEPVKPKAYKPLKQKRVHNGSVQEQMRNIYEAYNGGHIDEIQLKNELKHKLYIKLNENELDASIRNNQFNYKTLVHLCEKDYNNHQQRLTYNSEYFQKPNESKVQHSQNLWQYRRQQENVKGELKIVDDEYKKDQDYKEYIQKYSSPQRSIGLSKVDQFQQGLTTKQQLLSDLQNSKFNIQEVSDARVRSEVNINGTYLKNKILHQIKEENIANMKHSPVKNPKSFIETTQPLFKSFNEVQNIKQSDSQYRDKIKQEEEQRNEEMRVIFSSNGYVRTKTLGIGQFQSNNRDHGDIITWHTSKEDQQDYQSQIQKQTQKNQLRKMKSTEFFNSGLENINNHTVPALRNDKVVNGNSKGDNSNNNQINNNDQKEIINQIKQQQSRCFEYDDYVSPVKIKFSNQNRNLGQNVNIITWL